MPRWLLIVGILIGGGVSAAAADTLDLLPQWPTHRARPAIARGPTAAPAPLRVPDSASPITTSAPHQDPAVQPSSYQGALESELLLVGATTESSPSDRGGVSPMDEKKAATLPSNSMVDPPLTPLQPVVEPAAPLVDAAPRDTKRRLLGAVPSPPAGVTSASRPPMLDLSWSQLSSQSITTVGASLAVVLGLVFLLAWVWRRAAPRASRALPSEVVSVVGRIPLANRQMAQLIKIGGKLVLVNVTPEGAEPLTEITDPEEVARLLGICEQNNPHSASMAFQEVFEQLNREPAAPGFLGNEESLIDRQKLADAYANTPGGRAYA